LQNRFTEDSENADYDGDKNIMELLSPAKINLFLQVTGKRQDGYHELLMLMCCVSLYDTVSLEFGAENITVSCTAADVPEDESNLAHRAASLFLKTLNRCEGVNICIEKRIPVAAGLGGGSSNAAAVLTGMNQHCGNPFSQSELMDLGLSLGADVPFFIFGKPALASGIGEKLEAYKKIKPLKVLLIYPGFAVSTAEVYKKINLRLTNCKKELKSFRFKEGGFEADKDMCNDLETVTASQYPEITEIKALIWDQGAEGVLMSGSGSTVFGLFSDADAAELARQSLQKGNIALRNSRWKIFLADLLI